MSTFVTYPRLNAPAAREALHRLQHASASRLGEPEASRLERVRLLASTSTLHATWSNVGRRVDETVISAFRKGVAQIASRHGYPTLPYGGRAGGGFDSELVDEIQGLLPGMTPSEASKLDVWLFLTLSAVPDVAAWRWPIDPESKQGTLDRLVSARRNLLKRAWQRAELFGPELDRKLLEDDREAILGRPEVSHSPRVARAFANELLRFTAGLSQDDVRRREAVRPAFIRVLRATARVSFAALDDAQLEAVIRAGFEGRAVQVSDVIQRFTERCARAGLRVDGLLRIDQPVGSSTSLIEREIERHLQKHRDNPKARDVERILRELLSSWAEQSRAERQVTLAAVVYYLQHDDARADSGDGGFDDDLVVAVNAAEVVAGRA